MNKLLPCPFCGGAAGAIKNGNHFLVGCGTCNATVSRLDEGDAVHDWNRRAAVSGEPGVHAWVPANELVKWPHCCECGIIQRKDGLNKPCKGRAEISLRAVSGERVREALQELVACKDMKTEAEIASETFLPNADALRAEYKKRQPLAWKAAREALALPLAVPQEWK